MEEGTFGGLLADQNDDEVKDAEPAIDLWGPGSPELKDQFGRTYQFSSGMTDSHTGEVVMTFEALAWPDAITGARITLLWTAVQAVTCVTPSGDSSGYPVCTPGRRVTGSWTLPATIGVDNLSISWTTNTPSPVPEPISVILLGTVAAGLFLRRKLQKT